MVPVHLTSHLMLASSSLVDLISMLTAHQQIYIYIYIYQFDLNENNVHNQNNDMPNILNIYTLYIFFPQYDIRCVYGQIILARPSNYDPQISRFLIYP